VNPSQEPALPHRPDPTADPATGGLSPWAPDAAADSPPVPADLQGGYNLAHPTGPVDDPYDPATAGYPDAWGQPRPSRRPWRRTAVVAVLTAVVVLVLGGPLGLLWHWLAPSVPVLDAGPSGIVVNDPSPEEYIAADGLYTMLGLAFGLVVAVVAWMVLRKDRGPFLLLGVVVGTFGAGYLIGPWIGGSVGRGSYHHWQQTAIQGATYEAPPQVHSVGPRLVAAFAAAIVLTLLAGWSNDPDLDAPGARPGQGPNSDLESSGVV
jgi:hypothetical protein